MRVAVIQHDIVWEDAASTCARLTPQVAQAAGAGARLAVLTEMFATGFSLRTDLIVEDLDGPTVTWMHEQATAHELWIAGSVPLVDAPAAAHDEAARPTNSLLLVGPDGTRHRYDKVHPFSYGREHESFRAGTDEDAVVEVEGLRIGLSVCYDLRFSYLYWGRAARVDVELVVASWPAARRHHWRALLDARAIENQVYMVAANRIGTGGTLTYAGDSRIVDPAGEVLASAAGTEAILVADLDAAVVADVRAQLPFAADRRR